MSLDGKDIKFPTTHYVGFQTRPDKDGVPLGFMTPDGTDAAAKKRKDTVDTWARGYGYDAENKGALPAKSLENKPMSGFKLGRNIRHSSGGWGQGNVKWRIEDPRGFELEITSLNLAKILSCTTVENGEILEQCMWARLKNDNVLVPVSSDVYKAAVANTERSAKTASIKDVQLGDYVVLQNGAEGIYMGLYTIGYDGMTNYGFGSVDTSRKAHIFKIIVGKHQRYGNETGDTMRYIATPKFAEIKPCETPLTHAEAEKQIMDHIAKKGNWEEAVSYCYRNPNYVSAAGGKKKVVTVSRTLEDANLSSVLSGSFTVTDDNDKVVVAKVGNQYIGTTLHQLAGGRSRGAQMLGGRADLTGRVIDMDHYKATGELKSVQELERRSYGWGRDATTRLVDKNIPVFIKDVDSQGYQVRVTGTTESGTEINYVAHP